MPAEDRKTVMMRVPVETWELIKEMARIERRPLGQELAVLVERGVNASGVTSVGAAP